MFFRGFSDCGAAVASEGDGNCVRVHMGKYEGVHVNDCSAVEDPLGSLPLALALVYVLVRRNEQREQKCQGCLESR